MLSLWVAASDSFKLEIHCHPEDHACKKSCIIIMAGRSCNVVFCFHHGTGHSTDYPDAAYNLT